MGKFSANGQVGVADAGIEAVALVPNKGLNPSGLLGNKVSSLPWASLRQLRFCGVEVACSAWARGLNPETLDGPLMNAELDLELRLCELVRRTPWLLQILSCVRDHGPPGAYVAAGVVRNAVWDFLHERTATRPTGDVDVVYFESERDVVDWAARLGAALPVFSWDVQNQAEVHRWQSDYYRRPVSPYRSVAEALECWPETATAVAIRSSRANDIEILAPYGLCDLFELKLRPTPKLLDPEAFAARLRDKPWLSRWPSLRVARLPH